MATRDVKLAQIASLANGTGEWHGEAWSPPFEPFTTRSASEALRNSSILIRGESTGRRLASTMARHLSGQDQLESLSFVESEWWLSQGGHGTFDWKRIMPAMAVARLEFVWAPGSRDALGYCSSKLRPADYIVLALGMHDLVGRGSCPTVTRHNGSSWLACASSRTEGGEPVPSELRAPLPVNESALPRLTQLSGTIASALSCLCPLARRALVWRTLPPMCAVDCPFYTAKMNGEIALLNNLIRERLRTLNDTTCSPRIADWGSAMRAHDHDESRWSLAGELHNGFPHAYHYNNVGRQVELQLVYASALGTTGRGEEGSR